MGKHGFWYEAFHLYTASSITGSRNKYVFILVWFLLFVNYDSVAFVLAVATFFFISSRRSNAWWRVWSN